MKRFFTGFILFILFVFQLATKVEALGFSDNFDDNNTDGWVSFPQSTGYSTGNWRASGGILLEDAGNDHYKFLADGLDLEVQTIEGRLLVNSFGYAGITVWHKDIDNWVDILIYPDHNPNSLRVIEYVNGVSVVYVLYPLTSLSNTWYTLRVDSNSVTGELKIYLDGQLIKTHVVTTASRLGLSGFNSGNAGGKFDDFTLDYEVEGEESVSSVGTPQATITTSISSPSCNDQPPTNAPDLFQIDRFLKSAKLYFAPSSRISEYFISYSTAEKAEEHGIMVSLHYDGVQSYTINDLLSNMTYFFKVRGQNGCATGDWSQIMKMKTLTQGEGFTSEYFYK